MELEFKYNPHQKSWFMCQKDSAQFLSVPVKAVTNAETECVVATMVRDNKSAEGLLKIWVHGNGQQYGPEDHFVTVSKENPLFEMTLNQFAISSDYFEPGKELESNVLFGISQHQLERTPLTDHMWLNFWQIRLLTQFLSDRAHVSRVRGCAGLIFHEKKTGRSYLAMVGMMRPLEAGWVGKKPHPLIETDVGALYLYEPGFEDTDNTVNDMTVSVLEYKLHQVQRS